MKQGVTFLACLMLHSQKRNTWTKGHPHPLTMPQSKMNDPERWGVMPVEQPYTVVLPGGKTLLLHATPATLSSCQPPAQAA